MTNNKRHDIICKLSREGLHEIRNGIPASEGQQNFLKKAVDKNEIVWYNNQAVNEGWARDKEKYRKSLTNSWECDKIVCITCECETQKRTLKIEQHECK